MSAPHMPPGFTLGIEVHAEPPEGEGSLPTDSFAARFPPFSVVTGCGLLPTDPFATKLLPPLNGTDCELAQEQYDWLLKWLVPTLLVDAADAPLSGRCSFRGSHVGELCSDCKLTHAAACHYSHQQVDTHTVAPAWPHWVVVAGICRVKRNERHSSSQHSQRSVCQQRALLSSST